MHWESLDWEVLDRLRQDFLSGRAADGPYWHTVTDLECYDFTYGERIGWKWDAVLGELRRLGWSPPAGATVLDWGCGSGIAGRRVVAAGGADRCGRLLLHDRSPLAMDYARHRARRAFPALPVDAAGRGLLEGDEPVDVLVVSHVLNELDDAARAQLAGLGARAGAVLWVEPGTHEVSRTLGGWRESLRAGGLQPVAPCPHAGPCGMLAAGNERHWCHFFAPPPAGIHADSGWVKFGQRAGIDLRSLPYSYLALDRRPATAAPGASRVIGLPRVYKGFARIFNCDATGVAELTLQKRDAPALFKSLKHGLEPTLRGWTHADGRIVRTDFLQPEP
jgi:hypothetical protein